ncbi:MAG TPA: glycosyltransferase family 39 protein [Acidimicrobiia bacterium]
MPTRVAVGALLGIVALSLFVHLRGLTHDLPAPGADEPYFVLPAARMAWKGDPDPRWFGHPGSTVIYPLAIAYRLRDVLFHGAPLVGTAPSVADRFRTDPSSFYEIGRLWVILLSVGTIPLLWLVGRRAFDDLTALFAAAAWTLVPLVVRYGTIVRTDAAAACFGMLALWLCLLALDRPRTRTFLLAGGAIGLAVASRYFMIALLPVLVAAWVVARRCDREHVSWGAGAAGLGGALGVFALTTPFFFLDWHAVERSLQAETVGTVTNNQSGWPGNLGFYVGNAVPGAISWVGVGLATIGLVIACARRDTRRLLLAGWVALFLAVISLSSLEWQRWIIPVLPAVLLFAASAVVAGALLVARVLRSATSRRWAVAALVTAGLVLLVAEPAVALVDYERAQAAPTTREEMRAWIIDHVPKGALVATEVKGPELRTAGYRVLDRFDLPHDGTIGDYAAHGYEYLVVNAFVSLRYRLDAARYPLHADFYRFLRERARLLADFRDSDGATGPHLKLYYLDPVMVAGPHHPENVTITSRSAHDRLDDPKPLYPVGEDIYREPEPDTRPSPAQRLGTVRGAHRR